MLDVPLIVRPVKAYEYDYFPADELKALYRTAEINLQLTFGDAVIYNPDNPSDKELLLQKFAPGHSTSLPHPGLLLLGEAYPRDNANGRLVDLQRRGIAVVYQASSYIKDRKEEGIFEVCAHEIGHMLNLRHEHAYGSDTTVMDVSITRRRGDKKAAWDHALTVAGTEARPAIGDFLTSFEQGQYRTLGFPWSVSSRKRLSDTRFRDETLPWSGPFDGDNADWDRTINDGLSIELVLDQDVYHVGEPLSFLLTISNRSPRRSPVPESVSPDCGGTRIYVRRPDGIRFHAQPEAPTCALDSRDLAPGERMSIPVVLTDGPGRAVFSIPGWHHITGECGSLGLYLPPLDIQVAAAETKAATSTLFRDFLRAGAPSRRRQQQAILDGLLSSRSAGLRPLWKGFLASRRLMTATRPSERAALLDIVRNTRGAQALRMTAMVSEIARLSREGNRKAVDAAIAAARKVLPEDESHKWFFEAVAPHVHRASTIELKRRDK